MRVARHKTGGVDIIELAGKITIGEGEAELRGAVEQSLADGVRKIVIDMEKVSFIDSAGLGELVACTKKAAEAGGRLGLLRPMGQVADLLSLTRIADICRIYDDEGTALASFEGE